MKSKSLTSDYTLFLGGKREVSWFEKNLERKLGDGRNLSFWHENWLANESLASKYKKLFLNSCQKKNLVGDVGVWEDGIWRCCVIRARGEGVSAEFVCANIY